MIVFPSRKNYVTMENGIVTKKFKRVEAMEREKRNIEFLAERQILTPKILGSASDELYLKNIEGRTYCDLSNELSNEHIVALVKWLDDFHSKTEFSRGDVNLKNFIYNDISKSCFSVDYEDEFECVNVTLDYGRILAFIATYDPIFSKNKITACGVLIDSLSKKAIDLPRVRKEYFRELSSMEQRRHVTFESICVEKFWREITK